MMMSIIFFVVLVTGSEVMQMELNLANLSADHIQELRIFQGDLAPSGVTEREVPASPRGTSSVTRTTVPTPAVKKTRSKSWLLILIVIAIEVVVIIVILCIACLI